MIDDDWRERCRNPYTRPDDRCRVCGKGPIMTQDEETGRIGCRDCYAGFIRWLKRGLKGFIAGED
jgi:protein-arginine kinase activator protein McsA